MKIERAQEARIDSQAEALRTMDRLVERSLRAHSYDPLESIAREHLATGGKKVRAKLVFSAARALGISWEESLHFAAACEVLHNATLIHDDLQDGDEVRRGQPAVWVRYGAAQAINAGDLLLLLPILMLEDAPLPASIRAPLMGALSRRSMRAACGQALELDLLDARLLTWDAYRLSAQGKTGAFFALPVEGVALISGVSSLEARLIGDAVLPLGVLFQAQDDVLDLYGDKGRGSRGNDFKEGKVSALVVAHLELHPEDTEDLCRVLMRPRESTSDADIQRYSDRFLAGGAVELVAARIDALVQQILDTEVLKRFPEIRKLVLHVAREVSSPLEKALLQIRGA